MKTRILHPSLWVFFLVFLCAFHSCKPDSRPENPIEPKAPLGAVPEYFPEIPIPEENPLSISKVELGEKLFFDPILSLDSTISCGTCHQTGRAFTDNLAKSLGIKSRKNLRNAPTLFNIAYHPALFWDGGNPELEAQVIGPIEAHNEMNLNYALAIHRVADNLEYAELFQAVFNEDVSPKNLAESIAAYERTLLSFRSPFDLWFYENEQDAISEEAKLGYELFVSDALNCNSCHTPPLFTDFTFQNNGSKSDYGDDLGRQRISLDDLDHGKFKVPSLRNVTLTEPYMHDGSYETLSKVINNYAAGGTEHFNQSKEIKPFAISDEEKERLIAFLASLVDTSSYKLDSN